MPHKNTRKIIRIGKTSFAVIIPRAWLRHNNLGYGDEMDVVTNGKIIIQKKRRSNNNGLTK